MRWCTAMTCIAGILVVEILESTLATDKRPTVLPPTKKPHEQSQSQNAFGPNFDENYHYNVMKSLNGFFKEQRQRLYVRQDLLVLWTGGLTVLFALSFMGCVIYYYRYKRAKEQIEQQRKNRFNHEGELVPKRSPPPHGSSPVFCTNIADQEFMRIANAGGGLSAKYIQ